MLSELACPVCSNEFSNDNLPRLLTACGHTYCEGCIDTLLRQVEGGDYVISCPEDSIQLRLKSNDITQFPKNITLMNVVEAKKDNSNRSFKDEELQITKIPRKEDSHEDESEHELIRQMQSAEDKEADTHRTTIDSPLKLQKLPIARRPSMQEQKHPTCLVHQKPMDIVCLVDLQKLCAKCAIFGEHRGHEFKSIECIQQECNSHKEEIIKIYNEKEVIEKRIENDDTRKDILSLLHQQKQKLQKEISDKYRKLIERIRRTEELTYKRLDDIAVKTEGKIRSIIKTDCTVDRDYGEWEQESFGKILKLQEGTFEEKLQILYGNNNIESIICKGEDIVHKMAAKEEHILNQVEFIIQNITLDFNEDIYNHVDSFSRIAEGKNAYKDSLDHKAVEQVKDGLKNRSPSAAEECLLQEAEHVPKLQEFQLQLPTIKISPYIAKNEAKTEQKNQSTERLAIQDVVQVKPSQKLQRPAKKKLKAIKVPEKIEKVLEALYMDSLDILDLTNTQLGDAIILQICEFLRGTKVKTVKFIRCKITDECIPKMSAALGNVITLYLSQNQLTEASMEHIIKYRENMPHLRSLILSQNKIIERKHKVLIQKLRKLDLNVSV